MDSDEQNTLSGIAQVTSTAALPNYQTAPLDFVLPSVSASSIRTATRKFKGPNGKTIPVRLPPSGVRTSDGQPIVVRLPSQGPANIQNPAPPLKSSPLSNPLPAATPNASSSHKPVASVDQTKAWSSFAAFIDFQKRVREGKSGPWTWNTLEQMAQLAPPVGWRRPFEFSVAWINYVPREIEDPSSPAIATISFSYRDKLFEKQGGMGCFMGTIGKTAWNEFNNTSAIEAFSRAANSQLSRSTRNDAKRRCPTIARQLKIVMWRLADGTPQIGLKYAPSPERSG